MNTPTTTHTTHDLGLASLLATILSVWAWLMSAMARRRANLRRSLRKAVMTRSPRIIRHRLIRRAAALTTTNLGRIVIRPATSLADFHNAERLVHDSYVDRGWLKPQPSGRYKTYRNDGSSHTLVMDVDGQFAGTVTIVTDAGGLPLERTFPGALDAVRKAKGTKLVEVCSLAVAPPYRRSGIPVAMTVAMWRYAANVMGATHMVNVVSSHISDLYAALFNFKEITEVRNYEGVPQGDRPAEEDPVVGIMQDIGTAFDFVQRLYVRRPAMVTPRDLADQSFPATHEHFTVPVEKNAAKVIELPARETSGSLTKHAA